MSIIVLMHVVAVYFAVCRSRSSTLKLHGLSCPPLLLGPVPTMDLGHPSVVSTVPTRDVAPMDIATIRSALDNGDEGLIQVLVTSAHSSILKLLQAYLGQHVGLHGTMGNPVFVDTGIRHVASYFEDVLVSTLHPRFLFRPPWSAIETRNKAFSEYLMRFAEWGPPE